MALRVRRDSVTAKSRTMAKARTIGLELRSTVVDFIPSIRSRTLGPFTPVDP